MPVLDLKKHCPVCSTEGPAQGDNGEHTGVWRCPNDDCPKDYFAHSKVQFYRVEGKRWSWNNILEVEM